MLNYIQEFLGYFNGTPKDFITWGAIVVSTIIVCIGLIKPFFNFIKYKTLRKFLLSLTSIVCSCLYALVICLTEGVPFKFYPTAAVITSIATILTYWTYENVGLRDLVHKIGTSVLRRFGTFALKASNAKNADEVKTEFKKMKKDIITTTTKDILSTKKDKKHDNELDNL